jgi:hypothetical protein
MHVQHCCPVSGSCLVIAGSDRCSCYYQRRQTYEVPVWWFVWVIHTVLILLVSTADILFDRSFLVIAGNQYSLDLDHWICACLTCIQSLTACAVTFTGCIYNLWPCCGALVRPPHALAAVSHAKPMLGRCSACLCTPLHLLVSMSCCCCSHSPCCLLACGQRLRLEAFCCHKYCGHLVT